MQDDRDESGRFLKGMWKGGPGRAAKAKEEKYRRIFTEIVDPEKFRASCLQVWRDWEKVGQRRQNDRRCGFHSCYLSECVCAHCVVRTGPADSAHSDG